MSTLPRFLRPLALALLTGCALAPAAGAAGGTISGAVSGSLPKAGRGDTSVQALSGATGQIVAAATPTKSGSYSLKVPADGAYVVRTTIVAAGKPPSTAVLPVSVKKGQKRKGIKLTPKRKKKATRSALATRAYVQELGQVTPGVTAFSVEYFTTNAADGTDWGYLSQGLTDLLTTDLIGEGKTPCKTAVIANARDRKLVQAELDFQKSKYVDPTTRVKRNFIISDLTVNGSVTTTDGNTAAVKLTITDSRTGGVVDTIESTMDLDHFFDQEEQLVKTVAERVCRRPAAYKLTLGVDGTGNFATHSVTGRLDSELTALRSGGAAGELPTAWSGIAPMAWANIAFSSKMGDCYYSAPLAPGISWSAQLALEGDANVKLTWGPVGNDSATGTVNCPDPEGHIVSVAGQPGPSLIGVQPTTAVLPLAGGKVTINGGFTSGSDGWTNIGSIVVQPIWSKDPPK